jgi:hypothetical protein
MEGVSIDESLTLAMFLGKDSQGGQISCLGDKK